jgi:hypothetical protein
MLKALLWKECHEQRWRVALATVWLLGMSAIGLKTRILSDVVVLIVIWTPMAFILPVFLGMGLFASERKAGTLAYLVAQPVRRGPLLAAKVIAGFVAYAMPVVIAGAVVCLAVGGRELSTGDLAGRIAVIAGFGGVFFAWQLPAGLRCRREETYILAGAVVLGCWIIHALVVDEWRLAERFGGWVWAMNPIAVLELVDAWHDRQLSEILTIAVVQGLVLMGLAFGLWLRFRRLREGRS